MALCSGWFMGKGFAGSVVMLAACLLLSMVPSGAAHEQKTMTVILTDSGSVNGNVSDASFVQGNALWFQMHDSTENATMKVMIDVDRDGLYNGSADNVSNTLVKSCELDENGTLIDGNCIVSHTYAFPLNAAVGAYNYSVIQIVENQTQQWNYTLIVYEDVHTDEGGPSIGDCFGAGCETEDASNQPTEEESVGFDRDSFLLISMIVGAVGFTFLVINSMEERRAGAASKHLGEKEEE